jgi:hypothetical protein
LGGVNTRLFAYRNPAKVAGLLLIDPSVDFHEFGSPSEYARKMDLAFYEDCLAQAGAGTLTAGQVRPGDPGPCVSAPNPRWPSDAAARITQVRSKASIFETTLAEFKSAYEVDVDEVAAARRSLGDVPLCFPRHKFSGPAYTSWPPWPPWPVAPPAPQRAWKFASQSARLLRTVLRDIGANLV